MGHGISWPTLRRTQRKTVGENAGCLLRQVGIEEVEILLAHSVWAEPLHAGPSSKCRLLLLGSSHDSDVDLSLAPTSLLAHLAHADTALTSTIFSPII